MQALTVSPSLFVPLVAIVFTRLARDGLPIFNFFVAAFFGADVDSYNGLIHVPDKSAD